MKLIILIFLMISPIVKSFAQQNVMVYLELTGKVKLGSPYIDPFKKPSKLVNKADSLTNFQEIEQITKQHTAADRVINELSLKGWSLVSAVCIPRDKEYVDKWHNTLVYYFKKEFQIDK